MLCKSPTTDAQELHASDLALRRRLVCSLEVRRWSGEDKNRPVGWPLAAGASPRTVMKTLGHSQIGLTMNTYTHVLPGIERTAVDAAAETIFG
jgi:integrase